MNKIESEILIKLSEKSLNSTQIYITLNYSEKGLYKVTDELNNTSIILFDGITVIYICEYSIFESIILIPKLESTNNLQSNSNITESLFLKAIALSNGEKYKDIK